MDRSRNRKLLVSVFNPQEAREAVLGGGRIIDSEDPKSALGNIKPINIMDISRAVLDAHRDLEVQLSTNIGEDQLLYYRSETGQAIQKSPYEMAGKSAQAAIGVAYAMGTRVHPVNIVKVGVDGMQLPLVRETLSEVVTSLRRTELFRESQVMAVLFVQDLDLWDARKRNDAVIKGLVELRQFHPVDKSAPDAFDLADYAVGTLRGPDGAPLFTDRSQVDLSSLKAKGALPDTATGSWVRLNELFRHSDYQLSSDPMNRRTDAEVIKNMVDAAADSGANSIMLDTSILTKSANLCLLDLSSDSRLVNLQKYDVGVGGLVRKGILKFAEVEQFVAYCHYRGIEANLAGSVVSYDAQQLWRLITGLDQMSTRGGSTAVQKNPYGAGQGEDTRAGRVTHRNLVCGLVAPEQGGCLNIPVRMQQDAQACAAIRTLREKSPGLKVYWVDKYGNQTDLDT